MVSVQIFCYPTSKMTPFHSVAAGIQIVADQPNTTVDAIESSVLQIGIKELAQTLWV